MTYTLSFGSVSHGTLRSEDLLSAFASELEEIARKAPTEETETARQLLADYAAMQPVDEDGAIEDGLGELVNEMLDELGNWCPDYAYFGSNEGDGSDFGCWPLWDSLRELPKVSDPSELDELDEDVSEAVFVNDHGNTSLYAKHNGEWREVWGIV